MDTVSVYVLEDLMNTEFQIRASTSPQEVPSEAVERWPSKFATELSEVSADEEIDEDSVDDESE